ncbi:hypothetical protein LWI29_010201 [Acer saccharum]|uniref:Uncharacterized protein n=1 Tax=Acer saccharum TaxID=4024 RepID=A0AA39SX62_ACESA|nr:hypothetical protein LWI29_010201 [Acer saccharum]
MVECVNANSNHFPNVISSSKLIGDRERCDQVKESSKLSVFSLGLGNRVKALMDKANEKGRVVKAIGGRGASAKILMEGFPNVGRDLVRLARLFWGEVVWMVGLLVLFLGKVGLRVRSPIVRVRVFGLDDGISRGVAVSSDQTIYINFEKDKGLLGSGLCPVGDDLGSPAIDLYVDLGDLEPFFRNGKMGADVASSSPTARRRGKKIFFFLLKSIG